MLPKEVRYEDIDVTFSRPCFLETISVLPFPCVLFLMPLGQISWLTNKLDRWCSAHGSKLPLIFKALLYDSLSKEDFINIHSAFSRTNALS